MVNTMLNSFYDKFIFTSGLKYKQNNFFLLNLPFVILPIDVLASIADKNDSELNRKIYYSVKDAIKTDLNKSFQINFGVHGDKGIDFMETFFTASGWGKIQRTNLNIEKKQALVTVSNSPVAQHCKKAKVPVDCFLRGFLAGIFSIYFKKDVDCVEVNCLAIGDNNCNFIIKPLKEFKFDKKLVRDQLDVK